MTFLFAKLMDTMSKDMKEHDDLGIEINDVDIYVLEWVDDVVSFAEGLTQQMKTLNFASEFAIKHKMVWGEQKC